MRVGQKLNLCVSARVFVDILSQSSSSFFNSVRVKLPCLFFRRRWFFLHCLQRSSIRAVADFKAITCPPPPKFIICTDLEFTTSPAIAFIQCCMPVLFLRPCVGQPYSLASFGLCCCLERFANVYGCEGSAFILQF